MNINTLGHVNQLVVELNGLKRHYQYLADCERHHPVSTITLNKGDGTQDTFNCRNSDAAAMLLTDAYRSALEEEIKWYENELTELGIEFTPVELRTAA